MIIQLKETSPVAIYKDLRSGAGPVITNALALRKKDWAETGDEDMDYEDDPIIAQVEFAYVAETYEIIPLANSHNHAIWSYGWKGHDGNYYFVPENMFVVLV